jgi:adenylosuccinate lyase
MIERYETAEMTAVFSDVARFQRYLDIELEVVDAWESIGVAPAGSGAACRARSPKVDVAFVAAVSERELITNHDVAAFVDVVQGAIGGPEANWIHYGCTSSDIVDTAWASLMRDALGPIIEAADALIATLVAMAEQHRTSVMIGRTHGIHAEPTTFGATCGLWALQIDRDRQRLAAAREQISVGKLSGAVGTYSNIDPRIEAFVCSRLGLQAVPATQVIARDRHAQYLYACASVGATIEQIAVNLRHLQRTEVREVQEGFRPGQKGSSAMPHKRNPISAETMSGLSRLLRGYLIAGLENVALWHERDISHSSVERVALPDASHVTHYVLRRMKTLLGGLTVDTDRMRSNLSASHGLVFSQGVLLALIESGLSRDEAYRIVQDSASRAWAEATDFRTLVENDPRAAALSATALDTAFDVRRAIEGAGRTVDAAQSLAAAR